ncbi:hypothetical protein BZB76_3029 [Actinomadura pelletieri DSM 43383]|uniref:Cell division protein FtsB n=1 Tax=Actinomadura pelletieri DSM 43383 TaxID=1120940 RepID=A0A495QNF5_9ACTN|nr:hypothetical protein [Actinomadura pelletieri]RKS74515.1 hypothetical protein BZB76_3029 [Actinomadura pelletieri DSM 43383]
MTTTTKRPPAKAPKKKPPARRTPAKPAAPTPAKSTRASAAPKTGAPKTTGPKSTGPKTTGPKTTAAKTAVPKTGAVKVAATAATGRSTARRAPARTPPRTPFVLLIVGLLGGALVSLLLLNTVLAKDAFTLTQLQQSNKRLDQQRQDYEEAIARAGSPANLARQAERLGLVRSPRGGWFFSGSGQASGGALRPVPTDAIATTGAAGVIGVPGTVVPGDGMPPAAGQGAR